MSEENKASQPLAAGSSAPDFALPARSGKTISLHDFAGQKDVLIYFYPKDDTPGCTRESCSLRDSWSELTKAGIEVLGISRDDAASHNAFAAKYNLPFELLTDADHAVHEAYGAWGQNPNPAWGIGPLRKSFLIGKDGKIKHVFDKVDTERHADQVLRAAGVAPAAKPAPAAPVAPKPAPPAPPAAKPAAPPAPAAAAPAPKAAAPAAPKAVAPRPAAPKAAAPKPAAPKKTVKKAVKKAAKKVARKVKKAVVKAKVRRAVRKAVKKTVRKKAAPKTRAAKRTARRSARKAVRKVRRTARKVRRVVRRVKRAAKKKR
jgi:peroxiredoxin Q/BCP